MSCEQTLVEKYKSWSSYLSHKNVFSVMWWNDERRSLISALVSSNEFTSTSSVALRTTLTNIVLVGLTTLDGVGARLDSFDVGFDECCGVEGFDECCGVEGFDELGVDRVFVDGASRVGDVSCCSMDASLQRDLTFIDWTGLAIDEMSTWKEDIFKHSEHPNTVWIWYLTIQNLETFEIQTFWRSDFKLFDFQMVWL